MAKIEQIREVYADAEDLPSFEAGTSEREAIIVASSVLDVALANMLAARVADLQKEAAEFLGLNGDGRAPAGTFGARIQLSRLVGLISENEAKILRALKELRNLFAHRLEMTFAHDDAQKALRKLYDAYRDNDPSIQNTSRAAGKIYEDLGQRLATDVGATIFLIQLAYGQMGHNFHALLAGKFRTLERIVAKLDL